MERIQEYNWFVTFSFIVQRKARAITKVIGRFTRALGQVFYLHYSHFRYRDHTQRLMCWWWLFNVLFFRLKGSPWYLDNFVGTNILDIHCWYLWNIWSLLSKHLARNLNFWLIKRFLIWSTAIECQKYC